LFGRFKPVKAFKKFNPTENGWNGWNDWNRLNALIRLGGARKSAVNDENLSGDEAIVQDQA
jgi:hypothetical protein